MKNQTNQDHSQNTHEVLGGRAYVFRRERSPYWQAAAFLNGHNFRHSTKEEDLRNAIQAAEEWYLRLRDQSTTGALPTADMPIHEPTFREIADQFIKEYTLLSSTVVLVLVLVRACLLGDGLHGVAFL